MRTARASGAELAIESAFENIPFSLSSILQSALRVCIKQMEFGKRSQAMAEAVAAYDRCTFFQGGQTRRLLCDEARTDIHFKG